MFQVVMGLGPSVVRLVFHGSFRLPGKRLRKCVPLPGDGAKVGRTDGRGDWGWRGGVLGVGH